MPHQPLHLARVLPSIRLRVLLVLGCAGLLAQGATAQGYATQAVGDWTVARSKDGKGCFLTRTYEREGGTTLLLGLHADGANHLSALNANWSIDPKDRLKLDFRLSRGAYANQFATVSGSTS